MCLFFIGRGTLTEEQDVVVLNVDDSYETLPTKVHAFLKHACSAFEFDWLFKCDDDTYVALDRLGSIIDPAYDLIGNQYSKSLGAPSGGAGYFLSSELTRSLATDENVPKTGAEDVILARHAAGKGARFWFTPRLRWDHGRPPTASNDIVTCHWCGPARLKAIHSRFREEPLRTYEVRHTHWQDRLMLFESGFFSRETTSCMGRWSKDSQGRLKLQWFDWGMEVVAPNDGGYSNPKMQLRLTSTQVQDANTSQPARALLDNQADEDHARKRELMGKWFRSALVISLPDSDRRSTALTAAKEFTDGVVWVPGIIPAPDEIRWIQIKGMEAYENIQNFRNNYIRRALGCRLAGLAALEKGLELHQTESWNPRGFLVLQDDFVLLDFDHLCKCFAALPEDADALWLDTNMVRQATPATGNGTLRRLLGARLCTAFWISTNHAHSLVPDLRSANCEWDIFMERSMPAHLYYAPLSSVCVQRRGVSEITHSMKWGNHPT